MCKFGMAERNLLLIFVLSLLFSLYTTQVSANIFPFKWVYSEIAFLYQTICTGIFHRCSLYSSSSVLNVMSGYILRHSDCNSKMLLQFHKISPLITWSGQLWSHKTVDTWWNLVENNVLVRARVNTRDLNKQIIFYEVPSDISGFVCA